ncbi:MAG: redoxin family protein [Planctomycetota bacterium]
MRRTRMMAAVMTIAMGTTAGLASAQGLLEGTTAADVIAAERQHVEGLATATDVTMPDLMPGDDAPALKVANYVKGAPISEFEEGTAYLVDFWATWCGPCIAAMPHLTELQAKYEGDNFELIGVSIWERQQGDELIDHVTQWVEARDERMGYTVAIDDNGAMAESWMMTSGQRGIPTAMIVDRGGKIAWIGYGNEPTMDTALEAVIDGSWDLDQARADRVERVKQEATEGNQRIWYGRFMDLADDGENDRAAMLAAALLADGSLSHPQALNGMAWRIVENEGWSTDAAAVARDLAQAAIDKVGEDAAILDTLGWAYYRLGEYDNAIETQTKAVSAAGSADMKEELSKALETFKARGG